MLKDGATGRHGQPPTVSTKSPNPAEEAPVHRVRVDGFFMDRSPVTNRQFRQFVKATTHVTFAEIPPYPVDYPAPCPTCSTPARWSSSSRPEKWTRAIDVGGGLTSKEPIGATPTALRAPALVWMTTINTVKVRHKI